MPALKLPEAQTLGALLQGMAVLAPGEDVAVTGICTDSRAVAPGDLFLAYAGSHVHGLQFVADAVRAGAAAVAYDAAGTAATGPAGLPGTVPVIEVSILRERAGTIAARYFGQPARGLTIIGITGTNGKTSCAQFLAQALHHADRPCGVIGTLGNGRYGALSPGTHTTPDAVMLQRLLAQLRDEGVRHVVMEVSSHGLDQGRVNGVPFTVAVWTNLSRDHLDYHGDMAHYAAAKQRLFCHPGLGTAVINLNCPYGRALTARIDPEVRCVGYALGSGESALVQDVVRGTRLRLDAQGLQMDIESPWGSGTLRTGLLGRFNAANLLAALAALLALEVPLPQALARLSATRNVAGRMERFGGGARPLLVVDYAHTPDALEQVLAALRAHCAGELWCVFGCGGERDRGKRPLMGAAAERLADRIIVTDDNPRGEDPDAIVADILAGMRAPDAVRVERDRAAAIALAVRQAGRGDVVLVAGKGHEAWQQVGAQLRPFSDRRLAAELMGEQAP